MTRIALASLTVTLAACAGARSEQGAASNAGAAPAAASETARGSSQPGTMASQMAAICPMDVPGTTVAASDTADGEAITFTTTSTGQVDELRRRVRALANIHNQHMAGGSVASGPAGTGAGQADPHAHHEMVPSSRATVQDVENGASVSVAATDPAQAEQLRSAVRTHALEMQRAGCDMMHPSGPRG